MQTSNCYSDSLSHKKSSTLLYILHHKIHIDLQKASLEEKHFIEIWSSKFTNTQSTKCQCHTKFLLVIALPKIITTVTFIITTVTVQDFIFFKHYKTFSTIKVIADLTWTVWNTVHMHSWICNSTLCCPSKISDAMTAHFLTQKWSLCIHRNSLFSVICYSVLQLLHRQATFQYVLILTFDCIPWIHTVSTISRI